MELTASDIEIGHGNFSSRKEHVLWPLEELNPMKSRFPCCIVWTPLPIISWLAPYIGHIGICREDGAILDFAGSNFVNIDSFAYGPVAKYLQLDRAQCCFPSNLASHTCRQPYHHANHGMATSWDGALIASTHQYEHKCYNLFTCNCHSFVASCLNRLAFEGHARWNLLNLAVMVLWKGRWVDAMSVLHSFGPFVIVVSVGMLIAGWPFLVGITSFSFLLIVWFFLVTYCMKSLLD